MTRFVIDTGATLAQLHKCTLVSTDRKLLRRVGHLVPTATVDALT